MEPFRLARSGRIRPLVFLLLVQALWALPAPADEPKAGVVTIVQGQATVSRPIISQPVPLKVRDDVFLRDRIDTRENSVVRVLLAGKALVTVRELSIFTITEEPGRAIVDLQVGRLAVGVARKLLKPGESIEVRTPNAVAAIRGSFLVADVVIVGGTTQVVGGALQIVGGTPQTTFTALQVSVPITVSPRADPTITIPLTTNTTMGVSGSGASTTLTPVQPATPQQVAQATQTGQAPKPQEHAATSPVANVVVTEQVAVAAQLAEILAPPPSQTSTTTTTEPPKTTTTDLCVQCGQVQTTTGPTGPVIPSGSYFLVDKSNLQLSTGTSLSTFTSGTDPAVISQSDTLSGSGTPTSPQSVGAALVTATGANVSIAGGSSPPGPVIEIKDSTVAGSEAPLFSVSGTTLTVSSLLAIDPTTLTLGGSLLSLDSAALNSTSPLFKASAGSTITATTAGVPLINVASSTLNVTGSGNGIVSLDGSTLGVNGPFLSATGASTSIGVAGPLLRLSNASTFGGKDPFVRLSGGTLTADALALGVGDGNTFVLGGTTGSSEGLLLDLTGNAKATLRTLLEAPDSNAFTFGPADGQPLIRMVGSQLEITGTDPMLKLAGGTLPPVVGAGSDLVTLSAGSLTSAGPLLSIVPGASVGIGGALALADGAQASFTGGTDVVRIPSGASLTTTRSLFSLTGGSHLETVGGGALIFQDPSLLILNNSVLSATGSTVALSAALLNVVDSSPLILIPTDSGLSVGGSGVLGTTSLATLDSSSLTFPTTGALLSAANSTLSFINRAPLLSLTDSQIGTPSTPGGGTLVDLKDGSAMTVSGPVLQMTNSTANLAGPLITGSEGSSFASVGPLVKMSGGSLTADALAIGTGDNNTLTVSALPGSTGGLLLDLSGASATFRTLLETTGDDVAIFAPAAGQPLIKMGESNLTVTESAPLLSLEGPGTIDARALVATNPSGTTKTLSLAGSLLDLKGLTLSSLDPQISLSNMTLTQSGSQSLVRVSGSPVSVSGSLLSATESIVSTKASVLRIEGTTLTTGSLPLFTLTGGTFTTMGAASDLVTLAGGALTLGGALLSLSGPGTPSVSVGGDVLHVGSTLTGPASGSLISVGAGSLTANSLLGVETDLTLPGSLLSLSGTGSVEVTNALTLNGSLTTSGAPVLKVMGGELSASNSLVSFGANLLLNDSLLQQSGGMVTTGGDALPVGTRTLTGGTTPVFNLIGGTLTTGGHLVSVNGGTLAVGAGGVLSLTGDCGTPPCVSVGGDVLHVGSTLTGPASGSLISVGAGSLTADNLLAVETTLTLPGSLLTQTGGSVNVGSALALTAALTTTAGAPVLKVTDGELTATTLASLEAALILKDSFLTQSGGKVTTSEDALAVGAFTLDSTGTTKALFDLSGGTLSAGGHLASVNGGTLNLGGGLLNVTGTGLTSSTSLFSALNSTITATGGAALVDVSSGSLTVTGSGNSLLSLDNTDLVANGPLLVGSNSTISVSGPVLRFKNMSTLTKTGTGTPVISIDGGSLTADALGIADGSGNTINLAGKLLSLDNATLTLRTVGESVPDTDLDDFHLTLATNQPAIFMDRSTLNLTGVGEKLVEVGDNDSPTTEQGVALVATGTLASPSRLNLKGSLLEIERVTSNATDAAVQLNRAIVNQTETTRALIFADPQGQAIVMYGPMLEATDSTITTSGPALYFHGPGSLTSNTSSHFIDFDPTTVTSGSNFVLLDGGFNLTLHGKLLSSGDSTLSSGGANSFISVSGDADLVTTGTSAPLVYLSGGSVTGGGQFLHVSGSGSSASLSGQLLVSGETAITTGNNLVRIADGGALSSTTGLNLLDFTGGSFTGGVPGTVSGGSLLRMFSQAGQGGTSLTLTGPYLGSSGTTFWSKDGPAFNIADGATINAADDFAIFGTGSAKAAFSFFSLDTGTTIGTTVGSGAPVAVSVNSTLIGGTNFTFTTENNSPFLRLHNNVTLTQTGSSALVALDNSTVNAAGSFLSMHAASPAPTLTLGGSFLNATNGSTITTGNPAATGNTNTFLFIGDSATVTGPSGQTLLSLSGSSTDTAGNILTLRRSQSVSRPSRLTLSGPLLTATGNSSFNTTSLGFGAAFGTSPAACCNGFFIGQGAQLSAATMSPLIGLTSSTFNAGPDSQSGGSFFSVRDTFTGVPASELVAPSSVTLGSSSVTAGPLLTATDSPVSALFHLLDVTRSTLTSNSTGPLFQLIGTAGAPTSSRTLTLGGANPIDSSTASGSLLFTGSFTGGSNAPASVSLKGPYLDASKYTINTTAVALSVFNGATLIYDTTDPSLAFVKLDNSSLTTGSGFGGDFLNVSGLGGAAGTTPSTATFKGPLLLAQNNSSVTLVRDVIIGANDALITGSGPAAFVQLHDSDLTAGGLLGLFSGATLDIKGPLLSLGSTLTLGGNFATIGGGQLKLGGPILSMLSGTPTASIGGDLLNLSGTGAVTGPAGGLSLVDVAATSPTGLAIGGDLADLSGGSILTLSGPLATVSGGTVNVGNVLNLGTALTTPTAQPFLRVTGGSLHSTNSLATLGADLTLGGAFLSQSGGSVTSDGDALAIGGATLTSGSTAVFDLSGGTLTTTGSSHLVSLAGGTLALGGALLSLSGSPTITIGGDVLHVGSTVTGPSSGSLFSVAGGTLDVTGDLVDLAAGSTLDLKGPLATVSGGTVSAATALNLHADLTTPGGQPLLQVTNGSLTTTGSLATLAADLTLGGAFLAQSGGAITVGGDALALRGRSLTGGSAPVFNLTGGSLTVGGSLLSAASGTVTLGGPLLKAAGGAWISAGGAIGNVTLDFRSGTPGGVRIFDTLGRGGEVTGQEWKALGIAFSSPTLGLNVGCGSGTPCLGADAAFNNDFRGTLIGRFVVPNTNIPSTVSSLSIDFCCETNFPPGSTTTLFGPGGSTLAVLRGDVPTQSGLLESFSIQFAYDAIWNLTYDGGGGGSGAPLLLLGDGTRLTGTSTDPLILLSDRSGLSLGGRQLLKATSSVLTVAGDLLGVTGGSTLSSGASGALLELNGTALTAGTTGANTHLLHLSDVGSQVSLGGGLLSANGGSVTVQGDDVIEIRGGAKLTSTGSAALVDLTNSSLATSGTGCPWGCPQSLLHLFGTSGGNLSTLSLDGSLLKTTNSNISVPGNSDLLTIASGAKLTTTAFAPILDVTGGTHSIGKSVLKLDAALLEASAPLLKLTNSASTMTVGQDFAKLTGNASFGPSGSSSLLPGDALVMLNASKLIVNGSLFNLSGSSSLNVKGDLLYLGGDSLLILNGGGILRLSGSASTTVSATISGALIRFGAGSNSTIRISNNFCNNSCTTYTTLTGDIRVATNGNSYTIDFPTVVSKLVKGTGTITYQDTNNAKAAAILLSGKSTLTVQGNP